MKNLLILLILSIHIVLTASTFADEFNTVALKVHDNLDLTINGIETESGKSDFFLKRYINTLDSSGLYWKFDSVSPAFQAMNVNIKTFQYSTKEPADRHMLDIYHIDQPENSKVVIFIPGGAWRQGDKEFYESLGNTLAGYYGLTVAVVNYTLSNEEDGSAVHPDHINDVAEAFAWIKNNISPYGDSERLYLFGQSAGAHLASLLATDGSYLQKNGCDLSDIKAVISMSGPYDLTEFTEFPNNLLGLNEQEVLMFKKIMLDAFGDLTTGTLTQASPSTYINSFQPPFLVVYSYNDLSGLPESAENFVRAVRELEDPPEISLRGFEFSDYSDSVWDTAEYIASQEPAMAEYIGHYAEVVAINPQEPDNYITTLITEFLRSH